MWTVNLEKFPRINCKGTQREGKKRKKKAKENQTKIKICVYVFHNLRPKLELKNFFQPKICLN